MEKKRSFREFLKVLALGLEGTFGVDWLHKRPDFALAAEAGLGTCEWGELWESGYIQGDYLKISLRTKLLSRIL